MRNGTNYKRIICLVLVLAMSMMTACTTFDSFKHTFIDGANRKDDTDQVIRIGVFEPQTGRYAESGLSELKGIELANSIYNSVDGYRVELVNVDTQSSTNVTETAIQSLIEMKPVAIIGSAGEATSLIASRYIDSAMIPTITPSATNPLITQNHSYYFRASITGTQMGEGIADYAYRYLNSRHIGVITAINDTAATALLDGFNDKIKAFTDQNSNGGVADSANPIVMNEQTELKDSDISNLIRKMVRLSVDTLFIPFGTEMMDKFFTAVENSSLTNIRFIGTKAWGNSDFVSMLEKHPTIKVAFPYQSALGNNAAKTKEAERFEIEYANKYGNNDIPTENAALGYDSYLLLINAIHNAKSHKGSEIKAALMALKDVKCSTGSFTFDAKGNTVRSVNISTVRNGKVVSLHVTEDATQATEIEGIE